jgi:hypothetical protein
MAARRRTGFCALNQRNGLPRPWWDRVPRRVATAAVTAWSALPRAVRAAFAPLGRWLNPRQTTCAASVTAGPDAVTGVAELRGQGFEPIEEYTGAFWVARFWPEQHRRSVAETRPVWLDDPNSDGRLWLARSPWPPLNLAESLNVLWTWVERDHAALDEELWRQRVSEALRWDEATAVAWHRESGR